ncbi:hypothetical protein L208DRAFT_1331202, partial [Tricholoma matsutake]
VKAVRCGQGFDSYSAGNMFAHGTRTPMGRCPRDSYAMYQGMEADTVEGINSLFDHAEDGMILYETARSHHSQLCQDLQHETSEAVHLGITGTSLYLCNNYTSPLHIDKDKIQGLCSQYFLHADEELKEYAFIYASYCIYMVSRSNCLW